MEQLAVTSENVGALRIVRYTSGTVSKPSVRIFRGVAVKPYANYCFRDLARRESYIAEEIEKEAAREAYKASQKAARSAKAAAFVMPYKVGDVLHGSWGYDQTNCEFAQVVAIKGKRKIVIRGLAAKHAGGAGFMCENLVAVPDSFVGDELERVVDLYGGVRWNDHCTMKAWDGRPCYSSWYA